MFPEGFLTAKRIGTEVEAGSKKRALEAIATLLCSDLPGQEEKIFECLLERERLGSTGVGHGVALPHARSAKVADATGAFLRLSAAIDFDAIDDQPVDLIFGLLVPENATDKHIQILAGLARLFSDRETCTKLRNSDNPEEVLALLLHPHADAD